MKILYIHGFNGTPEGAKVEMLRHTFEKSEISAPQHASRAGNVFRLLDEIAGNRDSLNDVIPGSSLGGFWAHYISLKYEVGAVLVNPVIQPSLSLARLDYPFAAEYEAFETHFCASEISPRIVLLAADDDVVPYQDSCEH